MNVFELRPADSDGIRNESVVELLRVLVENVAVPLLDRYFGNFVDVSKELCEWLIH